MLAQRLSVLSEQTLIELVVAGCEKLPALKARADALIAEVKPLPAWCVDEVLLSPDLLPTLMSTLSIRECAAAAACSTWAMTYATHIGKFRIVLPKVQRTIPDLTWATGMCMLPGGVLAVSCSKQKKIRFEAATTALICTSLPSAAPVRSPQRSSFGR